MIDINILRKNPEILFDSQKRRFQDDRIIKDAINLDNQWRDILRKTNDKKAERNKLVREIGELVRKDESAELQKARGKQVDDDIEELEKKLTQLEQDRDQILKRIPNIVDPDAPVAIDETGNKPIYFEGEAAVFKEDLESFLVDSSEKMKYRLLDKKRESHVNLLVRRDFVNLETASITSGSRFYYILNDLVLLERSVEIFALKFLREKGFKLVEPPFMLNREATDGATDFSMFEDTLYKIDGEDLYLIATAEHPLAAYHANQIFEEGALPKLYAGISPCFRREAGAHGKDTKGIFRVHQFTKIEQFAFTTPEDSKNMHNVFLDNAKEFFRLLEIPFRVVDIATGDLGNLATRKFDIEAWYPSQGKFREVVSASNDLDYQSRRLKIRYRTKEGKQFVHTVNSTLVAVQRALVAIAENFQQEDGTITIPKVLRETMGKDSI